MIADLAAPYRLVVTVEDNGTCGGVGDAITRLLRDNGINTPSLGLGLCPEFHPHGTRDELLTHNGLAPAMLAATVHRALAGTGQPNVNSAIS
jgi:1-deoxy-D-xylulose-5-phosphate synthase